jgi:hypothetical protein
LEIPRRFDGDHTRVSSRCGTSLLAVGDVFF